MYATKVLSICMQLKVLSICMQLKVLSICIQLKVLYICMQLKVLSICMQLKVLSICMQLRFCLNIYIFFLFKKRRDFYRKCVQDMSNNTRANTRTLPECASIKDKKLLNIFKFVFKSGTT